MLHHLRLPARARRSMPVAAALLLAGCLSAPACAEDKKPATSLELIPADASFYSALLRNREQVEIVGRSKGWGRLTALPLYKLAWKSIEQQYSSDEGHLAPLRQFLKGPENRDLLAVIVEGLSDEIFFYGGNSFTGFVDLFQQLNWAQRFGPLLMFGTTDPTQRPMAQAHAMLRVLADNPDKLRIPELVIGLKIKDTRKAEAQVKRLEKVLKGQLDQQPMFKGRLQRVQVGSASFLTLKLDGEMVPWDQFPWKAMEKKEGEFADLQKKLKKLQMTIAVGVRDGFVLLSIGTSTEGLSQLGGQGARLSGRPELKPLQAAGDKRLTSISYASKALRAQTITTGQDVQHLAALVAQVLKDVDIPADKRKQIEADAAELSESLKKSLPTAGPTLSFSYLTPRGQESFEYDHGKYPTRVATKPLTLLEHVGGDPILAVVGRGKTSVEDYRAFSKWLQTTYGHIEPLILEKLEDKDKEKYEQVRKQFVPLLKRLDQITGTMLLPALADGQSAFVLDGKWKSKHWHPSFPDSDSALPLPEVGVVCGVSDAALMEKAMKAYWKLLQDVLTAAHEVEENNIPEHKLPDPKVARSDVGTLYTFPLPAEWQLDEQVAPTAGLSERVGVLALSAGHARRLLTRTPLRVEGGRMLAANRPLSGASYFSWSAFVDAASPWVMLGVDTWKQELARLVSENADDEKVHESIRSQVRTVLDVLKSFRVSISITYVEEGIFVTHTETVIRDERGDVD